MGMFGWLPCRPARYRLANQAQVQATIEEVFQVPTVLNVTEIAWFDGPPVETVIEYLVTNRLTGVRRVNYDVYADVRACRMLNLDRALRPATVVLAALRAVSAGTDLSNAFDHARFTTALRNEEMLPADGLKPESLVEEITLRLILDMVPTDSSGSWSLFRLAVNAVRDNPDLVTIARHIAENP
jgi:hypothetical protein